MASAIVASASPLLALCALACPVGMGAMMWFMARGSRSNANPSAQAPATLDDLRHEHERLGTQIESLEGSHTHAERTEPTERPVSGGRWVSRWLALGIRFKDEPPSARAPGAV